MNAFDCNQLHVYVPDLTLIERVNQGDGEAFTILAGRYARLLAGVEHEFSWAHGLMDREDLGQEALMGLWLACQTFDGSVGVKFGTYVGTHVRNRLRDAVRCAGAGKNRLVTDARSLEESVAAGPEGTAVLGDTISAPESCQPEVIAHIRDDLRKLATELPGLLSAGERNALGRLLNGEDVGKGSYTMVRRMRERAGRVLGVEPEQKPDRKARAATGLELLASGVSQAEVARRLGVSAGAVSVWHRRETARLALGAA